MQTKLQNAAIGASKVQADNDATISVNVANLEIELRLKPRRSKN